MSVSMSAFVSGCESAPVSVSVRMSVYGTEIRTLNHTYPRLTIAHHENTIRRHTTNAHH